MANELIVYQQPNSAIANLFKSTIHTIQLKNMPKEVKSLLITSAQKGVGKSWICANLAIAYAKLGKKVILIDADMRNGRQSSLFHVLPMPGLSDYLIGVQKRTSQIGSLYSYIRKTDIDNLYVIPAGRKLEKTTEILTTLGTKKAIEQIKTMGDIILIDTPAMQIAMDGILLANRVDNCIIVTHPKKTKAKQIRILERQIERNHGKVLGAIMNQVPTWDKKYQQYIYSNTNQEEVQKIKKEEEKEKLTLQKAQEMIAQIDKFLTKKSNVR